MAVECLLSTTIAGPQWGSHHAISSQSFKLPTTIAGRLCDRTSSLKGFLATPFSLVGAKKQA